MVARNCSIRPVREQLNFYFHYIFILAILFGDTKCQPRPPPLIPLPLSPTQAPLANIATEYNGHVSPLLHVSEKWRELETDREGEAERYARGLDPVENL